MFNDNFIWTEFLGTGQRSTDIKFKDIEEKEWQYEEDGLISDGFHTTSEGQEIIADLLYDLGD